VRRRRASASVVCAVVAALAFGARADDADRYDRHEARLLAQIPGIAHRDQATLTIKLGDGRSRVYESRFKACDVGPENCEVDTLWDYDAQQNIAIVLRSYYESYDFELLDLRTGNTIDAGDLPHPAPDRVSWAVVQVGIAFGGGDVQMIAHENGAFRLVGAIERPFCKFEKWDGPAAFLILCTEARDHPDHGEFRVAPVEGGKLQLQPTERIASQPEYDAIIRDQLLTDDDPESN
jgi:hypothetical protein